MKPEVDGNSGTIILYSKNIYSQEQIHAIATNIFLKYREKLVLYDKEALYEDGIIDYLTKVTYGISIEHLGEDAYPNEYKYVNAKKLCELIVKEYPDFSLNRRSTQFVFEKLSLNL